MLRREKKQKGQIKLFDSWIPTMFTQLRKELQHIDELLNDDRFYEPIRDKIKKVEADISFLPFY